MNKSFWKDKRVFITGHTGFKGGWLSLWLHNMGANIFGYSLKPTKKNNFFEITNLDKLLYKSTFEDIRDIKKLKKAISDASPEVIFHLAAQPLVKESYTNTLSTYETNIMGVVNLFEASISQENLKVIVNVTSDKCYRNDEDAKKFNEEDPLGGNDPYSSSKACAELISHAYYSSFFKNKNIAVATARAGNVIGGGDWADNRLIPDIINSLLIESKDLSIRSPESIRPWQHVLESLNGYLTLAEKLYKEGEFFSGSWNFGPNTNDMRNVSWITNYLMAKFGKSDWKLDLVNNFKEAKILNLDNSKSIQKLDWYPKFDLEQALDFTYSWYLAWSNKENMNSFSIDQLIKFENY